MKTQSIFLWCLLGWFGTTFTLQAETKDSLSLIPYPEQVEWSGKEGYHITQRTCIGYEESLQETAQYLADRLLQQTGFQLSLKKGPDKGNINLSLDSVKVSRSEGYILRVNRKGVQITAHDKCGAFYGVQTLLQLLPVKPMQTGKGNGPCLPAVEVVDAPSHPYRGMMLDVARFFFDKEFVKRFIDHMAVYKLNKLQLHLIDDSGWRVEIKQYPRLTEVGAWAGPEDHRLGGYYTQEDIREIVEYARVRCVDVIPEVEFPAHILSAVVAYPELSCSGEQHEMPVQHFISRDLLCVGKQHSLDFLKNVLDEVVELFPSPYVNIGGDEAVYDRWASCPHCLELMHREGLEKPSDLQGWLTNQVAGWLSEKGKTAIGWEEILLRGEVHTPVVSMIWHNAADTVQAIAGNHHAILAPAPHAYFDFPESGTPGEVKAATWLPPVPLEMAYTLPAADYSPASVTLGVQGCLWSDQFIHGNVLQPMAPIDENRAERYMEYLAFPRTLALDEVAWTPQRSRNYGQFLNRLSNHYPRLETMGWGYRVPEPVLNCVKTWDNGDEEVTLTSPVCGAEIAYTLDGSLPNIHSPKHHGAGIRIPKGVKLRAITVVTHRHHSLPVTFENATEE